MKYKPQKFLGFFYLLLWLSCLLLWNYLTALIQRCTVPKLSFKNSQKGIYLGDTLSWWSCTKWYVSSKFMTFLSHLELHWIAFSKLRCSNHIYIVSSSYSSPFLFFIYIMEKTWTTGVSETGEHMIISFFVWLVHW